VSHLHDLLAGLPGPDQAAGAAVRARATDILRPAGALARLDDLAAWVAEWQGTPTPAVRRPAALIFAADHGVAAAGVSAYPTEVTAAMLAAYEARRSTITAFAAVAGATVRAVDVGVGRPTADFRVEAALSPERLGDCVEAGVAAVEALDADLLVLGEMGIGNTTTSGAVASVLLGRPIGETTGTGAGLDPAGLDRKRSAVKRAIEINKPDPKDPLDVLAKIGGFDIAALAGVFIGGAAYDIPVVVDGVISATAALAAERLCPGARNCMIASHISEEPASRLILDALNLSPVLHAQMRLGEGTGAVAVLPLIDMALSVYRELMTFEDIGM